MVLNPNPNPNPNTSAGEEEERLSYPESGATATIICSPVVKCRYSGSYNIFRL